MPAARAPRVRLDPFVAAVRKDPGDTAPLCVVTGFVGRSPDKGKLRIYADAGLSHWVEAAEANVVHSVPIDDSPLGGSHLWLKGSAVLTPGSIAAGPGQPTGPTPPPMPMPMPFPPISLIVCPGIVSPTSSGCIAQPGPTCAPMYCVTQQPPPSATMPCMPGPGGGA